ncbi:hypothetical protein AB0L30_05430 [Microbispora rosea]
MFRPTMTILTNKEPTPRTEAHLRARFASDARVQRVGSIIRTVTP